MRALDAIGAELVGRVRLDPSLVQAHLSTWPISRAIQYDWMIAYAAIAPTAPRIEVGCELAALVAAR